MENILQNFPYFKGVHHGFISSVYNCLKPRIYPPQTNICTAGEIGTEMYFIYKGKVDILSVEGVVLNHLTDGDYFGEVALVSKERRFATCKAATFCELFIMSRVDMEKIMHKYPEEKIKIIQCVKQQRTHLLKMKTDMTRNMNNAKLKAMMLKEQEKDVGV